MTERLTNLSRSVADKVVLITGAASGMGRATAFLFADEGARVAVWDLDADAVGAVVERISDAGGVAHGVAVDVSDAEAIGRAVAEVRAELGPIDIVVNNAGVGAGSPLDGPGFEDEWIKAFDVMLTPHHRIVRACLDDLKASGEGRVINIASTEGIGAQRNMAPYTAAKHGVVGLTRALAVDLGVYGITVNAICPGPIVTGMTEFLSEEMRETFARRRTAVRRYGDPEEVAHMTLRLALPAASFVTGAILAVDGGLTVKND